MVLVLAESGFALDKTPGLPEFENLKQYEGSPVFTRLDPSLLADQSQVIVQGDMPLASDYVTYIYEGFEGSFPGTFWTAYDEDTRDGYDYWDDVSCRDFEGSRSAWCSDIGTTEDCSEYKNYMMAYMHNIEPIDASAWTSARISYWTWYNLEDGFDFIAVVFSGDGGNTWEYVLPLTGDCDGWEGYLMNVPSEFLTDEFTVGFVFYSDLSNVGYYEGAYVDNFRLEYIGPSPYLSSYSVPTPSDQVPFDATVRGEFCIVNPTDKDWDIGLGMSLEKDQTYYNDENNDEVVTVPAYDSDCYLRDFDMDGITDIGWYDAGFALWDGQPGSSQMIYGPYWMYNAFEYVECVSSCDCPASNNQQCNPASYECTLNWELCSSDSECGCGSCAASGLCVRDGATNLAVGEPCVLDSNCQSNYCDLSIGECSIDVDLADWYINPDDLMRGGSFEVHYTVSNIGNPYSIQVGLGAKVRWPDGTTRRDTANEDVVTIGPNSIGQYTRDFDIDGDWPGGLYDLRLKIFQGEPWGGGIELDDSGWQNDVLTVRECISGGCCTADGLIKPDTEVCFVNTERACYEGSFPGSDVWKRSRDQFCSGSSPLCDGGYGPWGSWSLYDDCTMSEYCPMYIAPPSCVTIETITADPRCTNDVSSGGVCTADVGQNMGVDNGYHLGEGDTTLDFVCYDWWNDDIYNPNGITLDGHEWDFCQGGCEDKVCHDGTNNCCDTTLSADAEHVLTDPEAGDRTVRVLAAGISWKLPVNIYSQDTLSFGWIPVCEETSGCDTCLDKPDEEPCDCIYECSGSYCIDSDSSLECSTTNDIQEGWYTYNSAPCGENGFAAKQISYGLYQCVECISWCPGDDVCVANHCVCESECSFFDGPRCNGNVVEECQWNGECYQWSGTDSCGQECCDGSCEECCDNDDCGVNEVCSDHQCTLCTTDDDNDGHKTLGCGGDDCDDSDDEVYGAAPELCDGKDNDCDGVIDEGCFCDDGTQSGVCSSSLPLFCDDGDLIDDCATCGCPENHVCQADGSCLLNPDENILLDYFCNDVDKNVQIFGKMDVYRDDMMQFALDNTVDVLWIVNNPLLSPEERADRLADISNGRPSLDVGPEDFESLNCLIGNILLEDEDVKMIKDTGGVVVYVGENGPYFVSGAILGFDIKNITVERELLDKIKVTIWFDSLPVARVTVLDPYIENSLFFDNYGLEFSDSIVGPISYSINNKVFLQVLKNPMPDIPFVDDLPISPFMVGVQSELSSTIAGPPTITTKMTLNDPHTLNDAEYELSGFMNGDIDCHEGVGGLVKVGGKAGFKGSMNDLPSVDITLLDVLQNIDNMSWEGSIRDSAYSALTGSSETDLDFLAGFSVKGGLGLGVGCEATDASINIAGGVTASASMPASTFASLSASMSDDEARAVSKYLAVSTVTMGRIYLHYEDVRTILSSSNPLIVIPALFRLGTQVGETIVQQIDATREFKQWLDVHASLVDELKDETMIGAKVMGGFEGHAAIFEGSAQGYIRALENLGSYVDMHSIYGGLGGDKRYEVAIGGEVELATGVDVGLNVGGQASLSKDLARLEITVEEDGGATIMGGFLLFINISDTGVDLDSDGLLDYLALDIGVDTGMSGSGVYSLTALIYSGDEYVAVASNESYLSNPGVIRLFFDGDEIRNSGFDGPYELKHLTIQKDGIQPSGIAITNTTIPEGILNYSIYDFESSGSYISSVVSEIPIDSDSDGLYDTIRVGIEVNLTEGDDYNIRARLGLSGDNSLYVESTDISLTAGEHLVYLDFTGEEITKAGSSDNYVLYDAGLFNDMWDRREIEHQQHLTQEYGRSDFEKPGVYLTDDYTVRTVDNDGDGFLDRLIIDVGVNVSLAGNYTLQAYLASDFNKTFASQKLLLPLGYSEFSLVFDSRDLSRLKGGELNLTELLLFAGNKTYGARTFAGTLGEFDGLSFEPREASIIGASLDFGNDVDNNSLYDYLTVVVDLSVHEAGVFELSGTMRCGNKTLYSQPKQAGLQAGLVSTQLEFFGYSIYNSGIINESCTLTRLALAKNGSSVDAIKAGHTTNIYHFEEFDHTSITCDDVDGDTYDTCEPDIDCDDSDPFVNPGAVEVCDEKDNDCDGQVDEGLNCSDGPYQYVEGVWIIGHSNNFGTYTNHLGQSVKGHFSTGDDYVMWDTAIVPDTYTEGRVTFIWMGRFSDYTANMTLFVNGLPTGIYFPGGITEDTVWTNADVELFFSRREGGVPYEGIYYLTVPTWFVDEWVSIVGPPMPAIIELHNIDTPLYGVMVYNVTDTAAVQKSLGLLDYSHIGRSDDSECMDIDNDGYDTCGLDADCHDFDSSINPGADEICDDNIDNNCDGLTDDQDPICAPTDPNLRLNLNFNGVDPYEDYAGDHTITPVGDPEIVDGVVGDAVHMDGDDYITTDLRFKDLDTFTVDLWAKFDEVFYAERIISNKYGGVELNLDNHNKFQMMVRNEGNQDLCRFSTDTVAETGKWYHIIASYDGEQCVLAVNGEVATKDAIDDLPKSGDIYLGFSAVGPQYYLRGTLDEVKIYDKVVYPDGLQLFVTSNGLDEYEDYISGASGTPEGDPQLTSGYFGPALSYDGDDYVKTSLQLNSFDEVTFDFMVNFDRVFVNERIFQNKYGGNGVNIDWKNRFEFLLTDMDNQLFCRTKSDIVAEAGEWYHVIASFDGEECLLSVDGAVKVQESLGATGDIKSGPLYLGYYHIPGMSFEGTLDDFKVYDKVVFENPCFDNDSDGYLGLSAQCIAGTDCDDADPLINPGVNETCDDEIDNNCNGLTDFYDAFCRDIPEDLRMRFTFDDPADPYFEYVSGSQGVPVGDPVASGGSLAFNGDDYLKSGLQISDDFDEVRFDVRVKLDEVFNGEHILTNKYGGNSIFISYDGMFVFSLLDNQNEKFCSLPGAQFIEPGMWYDVSASFDGTTCRMDVNGNVTTQPSVGATGAFKSGPMYLGFGVYGEQYNMKGTVGEVNIYDQA